MVLFDVGHFESEFVYLETLKIHILNQLQSQNVDIKISQYEKPIFRYI